MADEKPKGKRGPTSKGVSLKWTPEAVKLLLGAIRVGGTLKEACATAKIGYSTLFEWLAKETPEAAELADSIEKAKGEGTVSLLATIHAAAPKNWTAAAWILERRHPDRFGRPQRLELTGKDGGAVQVAAQVVLLPAPIHDADAWVKSVAVDQAKLAQKLD